MGVTDMLSGGCPVVHKQGSNEDEQQTTKVATLPARSSQVDSCASDDVNPDNQMLLQEKQSPSVGQSCPLPTDRSVSSIPKAEFTPTHQDQGSSHWEYPSQQMFYNAMKRKGWKPEERDMSTVLAIHNAVNETAWRQVREWEGLHQDTAENVRLSRFMGRPKDLSPKAFFRGLLGQERPFDRHDWYVLRGEEEVRYVIDFYNVRKDAESDPLAVYIDARPALDTPVGMLDRLRMGFKRIFSDKPPLKSSSYVPTLVTKPAEQQQQHGQESS